VAHAALDLYREVCDDFELIEIDHFGPGDVGPEGTVKVARFRLAGAELTCAHSPVSYALGSPPAVSVWIDCDEDTELERHFARLRQDGQTFMPLDDYGFSRRFGWVADRFGVTWQLNLRRTLGAVVGCRSVRRRRALVDTAAGPTSRVASRAHRDSTLPCGLSRSWTGSSSMFRWTFAAPLIPPCWAVRTSASGSLPVAAPWARRPDGRRDVLGPVPGSVPAVAR
jgi:predicted 3-demethylubiquinone-9 3-methyltransferase (glyoxalase superfamily)